MRLFCGRRCSGLAKRKRVPKSVKRVLKGIYDAEYRKRNRALLKAKKHAYFVRTYDPAQARVERKKRAGAHAEYCRRPEYKRWKSTYDRRHRSEKFYGPFAEVAMLTADLNREIKGRMTNHEIRWQTTRRTNRSSARARPKKKNGRALATASGAVTLIRPLSASSLKDVLWETLTDLKHENILPNRADAIAAQSREILRTIKTQLQIAGQAKRGIPQEIIQFSER